MIWLWAPLIPHQRRKELSSSIKIRSPEAQDALKHLLMPQLSLTAVCSPPGCVPRALDQRCPPGAEDTAPLPALRARIPLDENRTVAVQMVLVLLVFSHTLAAKKHPVSLLIL